TTIGYSTDEPLEFEPIQIKIEDFLNENKVKDLSAIILYEQELSKGKVIINEHAKDNSALTLDFINKWILSQV
ncbi:MAG: hypothetical protein PHY36_06085, partial [Methanocellales archaeon]|nr:hypothetical protein [Methanocellales archaeon]